MLDYIVMQMRKVNREKGYYMIIKSSRKVSGNMEVKLHSMDGSCHILRRKDHIKYLGVMIDESLSWKYHISYIFVLAFHVI